MYSWLEILLAMGAGAALGLALTGAPASDDLSLDLAARASAAAPSEARAAASMAGVASAAPGMPSAAASGPGAAASGSSATLNAQEADRSRKSRELPSPAPSLVRYGEVLFRSLHTKEVFTVPLEGITGGPSLDSFLRCRVTGDTTSMDPTPARVALGMAARFHANEIIVVSAFRSARFNEMLRKKGHQVAKESQHPQGHALDFRIPGVPARKLAAAIAEVHEGGIGTYRRSGFVHVDTGPKRDWTGR